MVNRPNKIIVHHTADDSPDDQIYKVDMYHKERGFSRSLKGWYVGYHYFIEKNGTLKQTRENWEFGEHDKGENINTLGVCLAGNFDIEIPKDKQIETLGKLLSDLCKEYKLTALNIEPHRKNDTTHCYGLLLNDMWASRVYLQYELSTIKKILTWILIQLQNYLKR